MSRNLQSPSKLTEFGPLSPEETSPIVGGLISRLFGFSSNIKKNDTPKSAQTPEDSTSSDSTSQELSWSEKDDSKISDDSPVVDTNSLRDTGGDGRRLSNVLKRMKNLVALKTSGLQSYEATELRQYWMPDSVSLECYECTEQFNIIKRRHHCRLCGQVFCAACCSQKVPGKIIRCRGDLRVCTYCCKVVLAYLRSPDVEADLTADLKSLQEDLQGKYGVSENSGASGESTSNAGLRRKHSIGYQEEQFGSARGSSPTLSDIDQRQMLQMSGSFRALHAELIKPGTGLPLGQLRYRLRSYIGVVLGTEIINWLIEHKKAANRKQALALCQALLTAEYIEYPCEEYNGEFNENSIYRPKQTSDLATIVEQRTVKLPSSSSSFCLDLDLHSRSVFLSRPPAGAEYPSDSDSPGESNVTLTSHTDVPIHTPLPESTPVSVHNKSRTLLWNSYRAHEQSLVSQLLNSVGLSQDWRKIIVPLCDRIAELIRPERSEDTKDMDIRQYVQIKKVPGRSISDCEIIEGIVCSKNVAHRGMSIRITNPRILLLECAIVYQRKEGRLLSLEPVMMQEDEYLRHVSARILALKPDIILVHRNVSRQAQEYLRNQGVTMALNVKLSVLERLARCTQADIITSVDAHIGTPRLGTCKTFYLQSFDDNKRGSKTLMFFEECSAPHLGCTLLLRGTHKKDLIKLKRITSLLLFARYNWKLEMSYLIDESAVPPSPKKTLFDSKENSPESEKHRNIESDNNTVYTESTSALSIEEIGVREKSLEVVGNASVASSETRLTVQSVSDFSDPLRSGALDDEVFINQKEALTQDTMAEQRPLDNRFRLALSHTVLSVSPHLTFPLPYLESEIGRKCLLRNYFPNELFYSKQIQEEANVKELPPSVTTNWLKDIEMKPQHPFVSYNITTRIDDIELQGILANFRACGGRLPYKGHSVYKSPDSDAVPPTKAVEFEEKDALHPSSHQRISLLLCGYSKQSNNYPGLCLNLCVSMNFYGEGDITLANFLEKYCFDVRHICLNNNCGAPMVQHIRRFIHDVGCIELSLEPFDKPTNSSGEVSDKSDIYIWSWCIHCKQPTPMTSISSEARILSFGKYLELRFHGSAYKSQMCVHSLHKEHYQYFTSKGIVACFKYYDIELWEISLPPSVIQITQHADTRGDTIEEIKVLALRGHEIFAAILERIGAVGGEVEGPAIKEQANFKSKVEFVQILLAEKANWKQIADAIVLVKRAISDACESWNSSLHGTERTTTLKQYPHENGQTLEEELDLDTAESNNDNISLSRSDCDSPTNNATPVATKKNHSLDQPDPKNAVMLKDGQRRSLDSNSIAAASSDGDDDRKPLSSNELAYSGYPTQDNFQRTEYLPKVVVTEYTNLDDLEQKIFQNIYKPKSSVSNYCFNKEEDNTATDSKGHQRSHSDGPQVPSDEKKEFNEKKSMKALFAQLKQSAVGGATVAQIPSPIPINEHYLLPVGIIPIGVKESEPASVIAYTLASHDYTRALEESPKCDPVNNRKSQDSTVDADELISQNSKIDSGKASKLQHIEINFQDSTTNFMCRVYFAHEFERLRELVMSPDDSRLELARSLSKSAYWAARGGKSGSTFSKTSDDRFILKEMKKLEMQIFCDFAPHYFLYMHSCVHNGTPTLLGKIVGVFRVIYRNAATSNQHSCNLLVMENLFYGKTVSHRFDLKGSERNRLADTDQLDEEVVLLDENFKKMCCDKPLYTHWHSHAVLSDAIKRDTDFLSRQSVMDYSLLVGLDEMNQQLVVGIIDYIRTFTWDKRLETIVKKTVTLGNQGKLPTVISPEEYRSRFREAMQRYFLSVPNRWDSLARRLEYTKV